MVSEINWNEEQRRLLTELTKIEMPQDLWLRLDNVVHQWVDEQREADRRWEVHQNQEGHR